MDNSKRKHSKEAVTKMKKQKLTNSQYNKASLEFKSVYRESSIFKQKGNLNLYQKYRNEAFSNFNRLHGFSAETDDTPPISPKQLCAESEKLLMLPNSNGHDLAYVTNITPPITPIDDNCSVSNSNSSNSSKSEHSVFKISKNINNARSVKNCAKKLTVKRHGKIMIGAKSKEKRKSFLDLSQFECGVAESQEVYDVKKANHIKKKSLRNTGDDLQSSTSVSTKHVANEIATARENGMTTKNPQKPTNKNYSEINNNVLKKTPQQLVSKKYNSEAQKNTVNKDICEFNEPEPQKCRDCDNSENYISEFTIKKILKPYHIGFSNLGNSCYISSCLQSLVAIREVLALLNADKNKMSMLGTLKNLCDQRENLKISRSLTQFRSFFVTEVNRNFNNRNQQDASEFLAFFISRAVSENKRFSEIFRVNYYEFIECDRCFKTTQRDVSENNMLLLSVAKKQVNVQQLLAQQLSFCPHCKNEAAPFKFKFTNLPKVLILLLKRYTGAGAGEEAKKINTPIAACQTVFVTHCVRDANLSCSTSVTERQRADDDQIQKASPNKEVERKYKLRSVIIHNGKELDSGHYYCRVYNSDSDTWFKYDDLTVTYSKSLNAEHIVNGYMLFYELDNN